VDPTSEVVTTGPKATHRAACWNMPTAREAVLARPDRPDHVPAPPPAGVHVEMPI
jgi:hypothetical protein